MANINLSKFSNTLFSFPRTVILPAGFNEFHYLKNRSAENWWINF